MKILTAKEMQRIEKLSFSAGESAEDFMDKAGVGIAAATVEFVEDLHLAKKVLLLVGKGNNGGDAYAAGIALLDKGYFVHAIQVFPLKDCSPLCRKKHQEFLQEGGTVEQLSHPKTHDCSVILDGLVGTGFTGKAAGPLAKAITWANQSGLPILALDIPSGLNGTTGEVGSVAIVATATLYLELPKLGFFIGEGWDHVGILIPVDFGMPEKFLKGAREEAHLLDPLDLELPPIKRSRHKYEAGYVLAVAGSQQMPGAAALATAAALRSGAGIVRLFSSPNSHLLSEVICEEYHLKRFQEEAKRAASVLVGPGLGNCEKILKLLLATIQLPTVIDGDALNALAKNPAWKIPKQSILTPHHGEMARLLKKTPTLETCQAYAEKRKATLILKGAPTMIFHPGEKPLIVPYGDPGMATAGSGDVLTGILAGLIAQKMEPLEAAALGCYLHGSAGELAAAHLTSYCMIASDILDFLPETLIDFVDRAF